MILLRHELGEVLREIRQDQGRTLRDVASSSAVSLGYLSELSAERKRPPPSCSPRCAPAWG